MKIDFTKKQYEDMVTLVYLGAWVINSNPTDDIAEQYEELEQYILSYSEEFGMEKYVEFDEELNRFFTTQKFEEDTNIEQYKEDYDDNIFWDELIYRLARRDLIKTFGEAAVFTMTTDELLEKEQPFIDRYELEFERNGIDNLEIKERAGYMFFETEGNA